MEIRKSDAMRRPAPPFNSKFKVQDLKLAGA
jgi:hypothetical protein